MKQMVRFFETGVVPVPAETTIEVYAFMEAANQSQRESGKKVRIADVIKQAQNLAVNQLHRYK